MNVVAKLLNNSLAGETLLETEQLKVQLSMVSNISRFLFMCVDTKNTTMDPVSSPQNTAQLVRAPHWCMKVRGFDRSPSGSQLFSYLIDMICRILFKNNLIALTCFICVQ